MPSNCCAFGCSARGGRDNVRFFRIPALHLHTSSLQAIARERRLGWLNAINRKDIKIESIKYQRICSRHFVSGKPAELKDRLHPDWIPSVNMGFRSTKNNKSVADTAKYERSKKRAISILNQKEVKHIESDCNEMRMEDQVLENDPEQNDQETELLNIVKDAVNRETQRLTDIINVQNQKIKMYEVEKNKSDQVQKRLKDGLQRQNKMVEQLRFQLKVKEISMESLKLSPTKLKYFTGLSDFLVLRNLFDFVKEYLTDSLLKQINVFDAFLLTLIKLRLNLPFAYLGYKYGTTSRTISKIFHHNIVVLNGRIGGLVRWPDRNTLDNNTLLFFKNVLGNSFTAIIDCFEIFIENPGNPEARANVYSSYKHHSIIKYLIAISGSGAIIFVSKGYGGRCSDKTLVETSGFLDNIQPGDTILADKGFLIQTAVMEKGAKVLMPLFRKGNEQFDIADVQKNRNLSNIRIHVERAIGSLRQKFLILSERQPITATSKHNGNEMYYDHILRVCCALYNLNPSIIKE